MLQGTLKFAVISHNGVFDIESASHWNFSSINLSYITTPKLKDGEVKALQSSSRAKWA